MKQPSFLIRASFVVCLACFLFIPGFASYSMAETPVAPPVRTCGTVMPPESVIRAMARGGAKSDCTLDQTVIKSEYYTTIHTYTIPVVFHMITASDGTTGYVSDADIAGQMEALNEDYRAKAGTKGKDGYDVRIQFTLAGIERYARDDWFNATTEEESIAIKAATSWDPERYLNYWSTNLGPDLLGYAVFPQWITPGDKNDGVVMNWPTVSGRDGSYAPFNQGRTGVHEVGHYLGLLHTFQGDDEHGLNSDCKNGYDGGDMIEDTPAEYGSASGCDTKTTCGTADDVTNYMNYSYDDCMDHFTQEQANRMICALVNYRPLLYTKTTEVMLTPMYELLLLNE